MKAKNVVLVLPLLLLGVSLMMPTKEEATKEKPISITTTNGTVAPLAKSSTTYGKDILLAIDNSTRNNKKGFFDTIVEIESLTHPRAKNSSHYGFCQLNEYWGSTHAGEAWDKEKTDIVEQIKACEKHFALCRQQTKSDVDVLNYLAHQQGFGGYKAVMNFINYDKPLPTNVVRNINSNLWSRALDLAKYDIHSREVQRHLVATWFNKYIALIEDTMDAIHTETIE